MVDEPIRYNAKPCGYSLWCHMWESEGDTAALDAFALKLGLKVTWRQDDHLLVHYDLTATKRALALSLGARRQNILDWYRGRYQNSLPGFEVGNGR